jgi:hypothetical protein
MALLKQCLATVEDQASPLSCYSCAAVFHTAETYPYFISLGNQVDKNYA